MANNTLLLKRSSVPGKQPTTANIQYGELSINYADGALYYVTATNTINSFLSNGSSLTSNVLTANTIVVNGNIGAGGQTNYYSTPIVTRSISAISNINSSYFEAVGNVGYYGGINFGNVTNRQASISSYTDGSLKFYVNYSSVGNAMTQAFTLTPNLAGIHAGSVYSTGYFFSNGINVTSNVVAISISNNNGGSASFDQSSGNLLVDVGGVQVLNVGQQQLAITGNLVVSAGEVVTGNIITGNVQNNGFLNVTTGSLSSDSQLILKGNVYRGGIGYHDFLRVTSTYSGVTNPNKYFRLSSTGNIQVLNSAYTSTLVDISDTGLISIGAVSGSTEANNIPTANAINFNNNGYIHDDGNMHITTNSGVLWLNSNDGSSVNINTQPPTGVTGGGLNVQGPITSYAAGSATAFVSTSAANSNVALSIQPGSGNIANQAIRDYTNGASTMYFDVSAGGSTNGSFQWRSSNSYNQLMSLNSTQLQVNEPVTLGGSGITAYLNVIGYKSYAISSYGFLGTGGAGTVSGSSGTVSYGIYCANRMQSGEVDVTSDERTKDIQGTIPLDKAIQFVRSVDGILYTWKPGFGDEGLKSGFSAQGVHKAGFDHMIGHIPNDSVTGQVDDDGWTHPDKMQLTMGYNQAIPYHHEVIKNLLNRIEKLESIISDLQKKNNQ